MKTFMGIPDILSFKKHYLWFENNTIYCR